MEDAKPLEQISASELDRYGYCPLSWWLGREGLEAKGPNVQSGEEKHRAAGEVLESARLEDASARQSEVGVLWFAVVATILGMVGITLLPFSYSDLFARLLTVVSLIWLLAAAFFLYRSETIPLKEERTRYESLIMVFGMVAAIMTIAGISLAIIVDPLVARFLEILALAWLIGASLFFYSSLRKRSRAADAKRSQGIDAKSTVEYVDTLHAKGTDQPGMLVSEKLGLRGRPDIILLVDGEHIPVEIKTGRTPRGALFSHVLQLGAYLVLLEEMYGKPPPYGLIRYSEREDKVSYDPETRMLVIFKMQEMRERIKSGEVHRNHNRPGKCINCSRREACPEKLA
jgi:CRISPR-associated exonuclease Cas4